MQTEANLRERAAALWTSTRFVLSIPPSRWPLNWHFAVVAVLIAVVGASWVSVGRLEHGRIDAARVHLAQAQQEFQKLTDAPANRATGVPLAEPGAVDRVVEDSGRFAALASIRIVSLQVEPVDASGKAAKQLRLSFKCTGDYAGIKRWIAELTGRYPWLALSSITLRPLAADARQLDASATFDLFQKGSM